MTSFAVQLDTLRELQRNALVVAASLEDAVLDDAIPDQACGDRRVADAYHGFVHNWSDGRAKIIRNLDALAEVVGRGRDAYEQAEQQICAAEGAPTGNPGQAR